ncbi:MAG: hypothetical protein H6610_04125 [Ignavibacteriales bacterium]|nr:hypothetical protein [Ignavibacteriales bacterium]MCB9218633.1 hypothetical protein [Ignavibacteriales bacterium]MCB9259361.1 hypothetical protein [Ignavibacteriales bacterium]
MKKLFTLIIILAASIIFAQDRPQERDHRHFSKKFEELEKIKLLEILNLDEETAIKFFVRRNQNRKNIDNIMENIENVFSKMEKALEKGENQQELTKLINEAKDLESKMLNERSNFLSSLNDILTKEQIVKVILFEHKFKKDIRDLLIEKGRKRFFKE